MQKLVYIDQLLSNAQDWLKTNDVGTTKHDWNNKDNAYWRSVVYTKDGFAITHGKIINQNILGGAAGSLIYQSAENTTTSLAIGTAGQILQVKNGVPSWQNETRYKININGTDKSNTQNTENDWGTIYAPTSTGSGGFPAWESNTWNWYTILTSITDSNSGIPTAAAIRDYVGTEVGTATAGLTGAMHYRDTTTVTVDNNGTITVAAISGVTFASGDVVVANASSTKPSAEYIYNGTTWREIGDESSYLLKTAKPFTTPNSTLSIGTGTIGTGITLDLASITQLNTTPTSNLTYGGTFTAITGVTRDGYGRVTGVATTTYTMPSTDEIDYSSSLFWADNSTTKVTTNPSEALSNPYLQLIQNNVLKTSVKFAGSTYLGVSANGDTITFVNNGIKTLSYTPTVTSGYTIGKLTINGNDTTIYGTNTWRPIYAYTKATNSTLTERLDNTTTGTKALQFGSEFVWDEGDSGGQNGVSEIHLAWAEVDSNGNVTYAI